MAFREYKVGARMFGVALGGSMMITLFFPTLDMTSVQSTEVGIDRALSFGRVGGFSYEDPLMQGKGKPITVVLKQDPKTGEEIDPMKAYVYEAGVPFASNVRLPRVLGPGVSDLSKEKGRVTQASEQEGAVFTIQKANYQGERLPYISNETAQRGWTPQDVLNAAESERDKRHIGAGKIMFVREGCWWCHTLLPEQTQDWQFFGAPPRLGDFNAESPTAFGSDRKAPDLTHVASRNSSREWMKMHFFNPRLVQEHSIMPRFDYLWGERDADGNEINYEQWRKEYNEYVKGERVYPPEIPEPRPDSEIRYLIDYVLSLK